MKDKAQETRLELEHEYTLWRAIRDILIERALLVVVAQVALVIGAAFLMTLLPALNAMLLWSVMQVLLGCVLTAQGVSRQDRERNVRRHQLLEHAIQGVDVASLVPLTWGQALAIRTKLALRSQRVGFIFVTGFSALCATLSIVEHPGRGLLFFLGSTAFLSTPLLLHALIEVVLPRANKRVEIKRTLTLERKKRTFERVDGALSLSNDLEDGANAQGALTQANEAGGLTQQHHV